MAKTTTIKGFEGLSYVHLTVPVRTVKDVGDVIDIAPQEMERLVSIALIEARVPICGQELKVISSALNMSTKKLAETIGVSDQTILNWQKKKTERLATAYEMAIRVLVATQLGIQLKATFQHLRADENPPKKLPINAA